MSYPSNPMSSPETAPRRSPAFLLPVYGATIFLSAALLFAVQPMFTKMVLPRLGGSPAVWSVAMVFFQALLLAGYAYAHVLTRFLPGRTAVLVQVGVMAIAVLTLPLAIRAGWGRPPQTGEAFWLIGLFAVSIGLPFFALSANGPLIQAWFARTDHPSASNPYFLYAASNIGSFLALLAYPVLIEPFIRLGDQTWAWSGGFILLILLVAASGAMLWRMPDRPQADAAADAAAAAPPTLRDALTWMALAAVPSGLLVAVTAHISTDVAAVPLLWVVPLALYLLTFVIVFSTRPAIPHWLAVMAQPAFVAALICVIVLEVTDSIVIQASAHILAFFVAALVCHGELARRRPAPRHLTAFYMWMSAGGMIGGLSAGLIAPYVFSWVAEYPILIVLALLCRPGLALPKGRGWLIWLAALAVAAVILYAMYESTERLDTWVRNLGVIALLAWTFVLWQRPLIFAAIVAFILIGNIVNTEDATSQTLRSFFGVHKISESDDGNYRILMHGTTIHGAERITPADEEEEEEEEDDKPKEEQPKKIAVADNEKKDRPTPLTYYFDGSPLAQTIDAARAKAGGPARVAVIGLGSGSLACQTKPGDKLTYYEIDPLVVRIARDPEKFTFLTKCAPDATIVLGDARLTLVDAPDAAYDLIIVDAFSSDAIPIHLLTREALELYARKIAPNGMVVMHLSNRHLELASVVAGIAQVNGLVMRLNDDETENADDDAYRFESTVAAVARQDEDFGALAKSEHWEVKKPDPAQWVWTDDYSNIIGSVIRKMRNE
jgi:hypothetical protein